MGVREDPLSLLCIFYLNPCTPSSAFFCLRSEIPEVFNVVCTLVWQIRHPFFTLLPFYLSMMTFCFFFRAEVVTLLLLGLSTFPLLFSTCRFRFSFSLSHLLSPHSPGPCVVLLQQFPPRFFFTPRLTDPFFQLIAQPLFGLFVFALPPLFIGLHRFYSFHLFTMLRSCL